MCSVRSFIFRRISDICTEINRQFVLLLLPPPLLLNMRFFSFWIEWIRSTRLRPFAVLCVFCSLPFVVWSRSNSDCVRRGFNYMACRMPYWRHATHFFFRTNSRAQSMAKHDATLTWYTVYFLCVSLAACITIIEMHLQNILATTAGSPSVNGFSIKSWFGYTQHSRRT